MTIVLMLSWVYEEAVLVGLALVVLRGEGPNSAVLRPIRASLQAVREDVLRCASGTSHSSIGMMKDLILETIGLRNSRMADGMLGFL